MVKTIFHIFTFINKIIKGCVGILRMQNKTLMMFKKQTCILA